MIVRLPDTARQPRTKRARDALPSLLDVTNMADRPIKGARKAYACLMVGTLIKTRRVFLADDMKVVSVATADSRAYYSILSRLKRTNLHFVSITLSQAVKDQRALIIITTRKELGFFDEDVTSIPIEEL